MVLEGLKGERRIRESRNECGISQGMYYKWRDQLLHMEPIYLSWVEWIMPGSFALCIKNEKRIRPTCAVKSQSGITGRIAPYYSVCNLTATGTRLEKAGKWKF